MSKKRRSIIKKITPKTLLERKIRNANERLTSLKKAGFGTDTWAAKKLTEKLTTTKVNFIDKKTGKIKINGNINRSQKRVLERSINNFMRSETSTPEGIEDVRTRTIKSLAQNLGSPERPMSYEDAETYYNMFGDNDFTFFSDKYGASEVWALLETSIEEEDDLPTFLIRFQAHLTDINDDDLLEKATRLYEHYVI